MFDQRDLSIQIVLSNRAFSTSISDFPLVRSISIPSKSICLNRSPK